MFDDENDNEVPQLTINEKYAEVYDKWREKEELQKLKDKYGDADGVDGEESDSGTESDDLDEQDLDPKLEKSFLTVLSALKNKDDKLYDPQAKFYDEPELQISNADSKNPSKSSVDHASVGKSRKKEKPLFLKDYERQVIMDKKGKLVDEPDEDVGKKLDELPYVVKQQELKANFKLSENLAESDDDDFLKPRIKSRDEQKKEEEDYLEWLKGRKEALSNEDDVIKLKSLHDYWNDPKLDEGERFLKDFILNKRYLDNDSFEQGEAAKIPSYDEVVNDREIQQEDLDEDEENLEAQEQFEHKYNFRFEEPDDDFLKSYPRTVKDSLRRVDDKGKKKREAYKQRKEREKEQKRQEIKRLKSLKRKEIVEKIKKVKKVTGNDDLPLDPEEFERDFDPAEYDRLMSEMFDEKYYEEGGVEEEKPAFSSDSDADTDEEQINNMVLNRKKDGKSEGDPAPRAEFTDGDEERASTSRANSLKAVKKESKFLQAVKRQKPLFNPDEKTFEQYFDEYYKLDYEDIIGGGDTVCRFKYRKVTPNDFGLTTEEILYAKPNELNSWVSVKKMSQYRPESDEIYDVGAYKKKAEDESKKRKILLSLYNQEESPNEEKSDPVVAPTETGSSSAILNKNVKIDSEPEKKHKKRRRKHNSGKTRQLDVSNKSDSKSTVSATKSKPQRIIEQLSDDRLKAYGINPKRLKNKMKYSKN